jgi:hypothetical protein
VSRGLSTILTLARGHYCPKEHQQHLDLAAFYPKIAVAICIFRDVEVLLNLSVGVGEEGPLGAHRRAELLQSQNQ